MVEGMGDFAGLPPEVQGDEDLDLVEPGREGGILRAGKDAEPLLQTVTVAINRRRKVVLGGELQRYPVHTLDTQPETLIILIGASAPDRSVCTGQAARVFGQADDGDRKGLGLDGSELVRRAGAP